MFALSCVVFLNFTLFLFSSDDKTLHFGAIVCLLGARYKSYCSNIGRTLLVNPTEKMQVCFSRLLPLLSLRSNDFIVL